MNTRKKSPPKPAAWLLELFTRQEELNFRLGDFEEVYHSISADSGVLKASLWYWMQVLRSIPGLISNSIYWSVVMIKNYVKIALRNLYKNKLYAVINIFGLGAAIAVSITGYINYQYSQSFDKFHINAENIYLVNTYRTVNNNRINLASSPTPLTPALKADLPGIDQFVRIARNTAILRYNDQVFNESVYYMDENFFNMFTFPIIKGSKDALKSKNSIIITDEIAKKYFGDENPIGKQIILSPDAENEYMFYVQGIIAKPPTNSSLRFSVCIPYENQVDMLGYDIKAWNDWTSAAFIQINPEASPIHIENQLKNYVRQVNNAGSNYRIGGFYLTAFPKVSQSTRTLNGHSFNNGIHMSQIVAPSVMALMVLLLACFNFVNTAVAFASRRMKEIGIRKVMGGRRGQLVRQFFSENIILCLAAFLLGLILAPLFTDVYDSLFPDNTFSINYLGNPELVVFLFILLFFTAIAAGAYPALYISKFNPVTIFSGKQKLGGTNLLIRILLSLQFSISIAAILSSIVSYKNSQFIENFDLGFNKEQVFVLPVKNENQYNLLKSTLQNNNDIISIGASNHLPGRAWTTRDIEIDQVVSRLQVIDIGENYFETVGFRLMEGNTFDSNLKSENEQSVLINENMVNTLGLSSPVGKYIRFTSESPVKECRIIGIVNDFHMSGLWERVEPVVIRYAAPENYRFLSAKFNLNNSKAVADYMQSTWKELYPYIPYSGFFATEILFETTVITNAIKLLFIYIALIVVITSGMGLFALVSLNIVKRTKEIGIRKVLGANLFNISYLISKEFIILLIIATVLGSVMGYGLLTALLSSIWAYYTDFGIIPFILAGLIMLFIALMTVGSRVFAVATANPVDSIRYE